MQLTDTQAMLRYQQENPWDRSARLVFTDYLRDHGFDEVAESVEQSLEKAGAMPLRGYAQFIYDGWLTQPECEIFKGVWMKFCWIPAGKATLGSPAGVGMDNGGFGDKREYEYETKGFWLGKYQVTQKQWLGVMGKNPSYFVGAQLPVETVSWDDCQEFIEKCAVKGFDVRLPYEDEWEYACRGGLGNNREFYWGDELNGDKANCDGRYPYGTEAKGVFLQKTTVVGRYENVAPHPWGLCDMSGNVVEWCSGVWFDYDRAQPCRGGNWNNDARFCRSAHRNRFIATYSNYDLGLRVVLAPQG